MVDPEVLVNVGLDPEQWGGFAFGCGIERVAQLRWDFPDIRALWEGDNNWLDEHFHCGCCCHEHTNGGCPARIWGGCRGQYSDDCDHESWARFYETAHGMTREQFFLG